jgi:hypothetical protein
LNLRQIDHCGLGECLLMAKARSGYSRRIGIASATIYLAICGDTM